MLDQRGEIGSNGLGVDDVNESVGFIFISGGALNNGGGALESNGIIPLLLDEDENEYDRVVCNDDDDSCGLVLLFEDEKHRSVACNGGKLRRLPCIKANDELYGWGSFGGGARTDGFILFNPGDGYIRELLYDIRGGWEWNDDGEIKWDCIWYSSGGVTLWVSLAPNNFFRISCTSDGFDRSSWTCSIGGTETGGGGGTVPVSFCNGGGGGGGGRGGGAGYEKLGVFW